MRGFAAHFFCAKNERKMKKTYLKQVGERLQECRTRSFFSRKELAEQANVAVQKVRLMERGEEAVNIEEAIKICNVLDFSLDYILTGNCGIKEWVRLNQKFLSLPEDNSENLQRIVQTFWNNCPRKMK